MNLDDLAAKATQARRRTEEAARRRVRAAALSPTGRAAADAAHTVRFFSQLAAGLRWLWHSTAPARIVLCWLVLRFARAYSRLWDRVVYVPIHGVRVFRPPRAGVMALATFAVVWFCALPMIECVWDASLYMLTGHVNEEIYLRGSQELNPSDSLHAVKGCRAQVCDDSEAIYFRVENDLFSNVWSLAHGRGLFFPEYVAAAVPYETTRCVASSFGLRFRGTIRYFNWFPQLLAASCDAGRR